MNYVMVVILILLNGTAQNFAARAPSKEACEKQISAAVSVIAKQNAKNDPAEYVVQHAIACVPLEKSPQGTST